MEELLTMRNIRKIDKDSAIAAKKILFNSYIEFEGGKPDLSEEDLNKARDKYLDVNKNFDDCLYGCFDDEVLKGVMYIKTRNMNLFGTDIKVGCDGGLAVDLLHKKERVAYSMIKESVEISLADGGLIQTLYPFNAAFYRKMGFGYGGKVQKYRINPLSFPKGDRSHLSFLGEDSIKDIEACFEEYRKKYTGMMQKDSGDYLRLVKYSNRTIGYIKDGKLFGYMNLDYEVSNRHDKYIVVNELVYNTKEALYGFCAFFNSQADQYHTIHINSHDEFLHFIVEDAKRDKKDVDMPDNNETYTYYPGVMYRITDLKGIIDTVEHNFGGKTLKLQLDIADDIFGDKSYGIEFNNGKASNVDIGSCDVKVSMNIADFSSMFMGTIDFKSLLSYGLAEIDNDKYIDDIECIFRTDRPPMCTKFF